MDPTRSSTFNRPTLLRESAVSLSDPSVEWNFHVFPPSKSDKLIFLTPWGTNTTRPGGYIFDEHGELVWDGSEYGPSMTFTPSTYQGKPVIAHWQGIMPVPGQGKGHNLILDQTYTVVANL